MSVNDDHVLLKVLEREIQHINSKLDELKDQIAGLSEVMDKQVLCPAPGTCVTLLHRIQTVESKIEHHEKNLEHLTAAMNKALGGAKVLIVIGTVAGSVIGFLGKFTIGKLWP